ncbi:MAG: PEP-CTERM sorting domain-containing protein [Gammaproteobacteria bacterium]|nr:MAG: PEP-CTERM sorting domain-containing protein [Gammaproteobacteria bacterium]
MGQPGTVSLDFPYGTPKVSLFPASGDFALEIRFQYTGIAGKGDGIVLLGPGNEGQIAGLWQDSNGMYVSTGAISHTFANSTSAHVLRLELTGLNLKGLLDGTLLSTALLSVRPDHLWMGHPSIGQVLSVNPGGIAAGHVDTTGQVTSRWWGNGAWTTFDVDYLRVEQLGASVPEPATGLLFLTALLGLGISGGRRRRSRAG